MAPWRRKKGKEGSPLFSGGEKQAGMVAERAMQVHPGACPACLQRFEHPGLKSKFYPQPCDLEKNGLFLQKSVPSSANRNNNNPLQVCSKHLTDK